MEDILNMTPWDFNDICQFTVERSDTLNKKSSTKPLRQSQKDMIAKAKGGK